MAGKTSVEWFDMPEVPYRASQVCRILGNPKAYQILKELRKLGTATPSELAPRINRSQSTVCLHLKTLREVHLVRYQRAGKNTLYRLKNRHVGALIDRLESLVQETRMQLR
ncbi:MAG: ArsR/SmtB family transcription factor [Planctomycetota bacterium]|jgi:DNA-binding transcriptional ArsR family regulator